MKRGQRSKSYSKRGADRGGTGKTETRVERQNISLSSMLKLLHALVLSIFSYACEVRTLTAELQRTIQAVEMRCEYTASDIQNISQMRQ